ncbi:hypothetical protein QOZ80_5BG0438820 [Eleusine coracana subsp. coracana]|nr:hypothetical protein QOZ80_5BG0438820 [Eleusine coracana subsp. coracana]
MISNLQDDFLLRILAFLPTAADVARASTVLKRWHHLWHNANAFQFNVCSEQPEDHDEAAATANTRRLIDAASAAITRHAEEGPDVEEVELSFIYWSKEEDTFSYGPHYHAADIIAAHVEEWLRFAACRVTRRFLLALPMVNEAEEEEEAEEEDSEDEQEEVEEEEEDVVEVQVDQEDQEELVAEAEDIETEVEAKEDDEAVMPMAEKLGEDSTIVEFNDDNLDDNKNNDDDDDMEEEEEEEEENVIIAELPCSPRLAEMSLTLGKAILKLKHIVGLSLLCLDAADTLAELTLHDFLDLHTLDVEVPGLQMLSVQNCNEITEAARISAPQLKELEFVNNAKRLELDGAAY